VLYAKGDYRGAAGYFQQALKHDARGAKNWYDLAVVSAYEHDDRQATEALRKAIELEPEFYGQALGDTELDPIRDSIDHLLLDLRNEQRKTVEEFGPRVGKLQRLSAKVRQLVPAAPAVPPEVEMSVAEARKRNTFFAWHDAHARLLTTFLETPRRLFTAVKHAIDVLEDKQRRSLNDAEEIHEAEAQRRENARKTAEAQLQAEKSSSDLFDGGAGMGCFAYALLGLIGGVVGAVVGAFGHHAGWGFLLGAVAVSIGYALLHGLKTASLQSATNEAETAVNEVRSKITRDANAKKAALEHELNGLHALRTEIATAFNL
jgi:uncharacterized membrane protein YeaQ/YmgE (transglycosylase-associated protein family)